MNFSRTAKSALSDALPHIIYVEGKDDAYFIDKLLEELGASPLNVGIVYLEGDGALRKELGILIKSSAYVQRKTLKLAFFLDADADAQIRLTNINAAFADVGLPQVAHGNFEIYDSGRSVGVYIFPDGQSTGELEDLLLQTVAADDRLEIVSNSLQVVEEQYGELNKRSKRIARMYISVLPIKPCGVGRAYREGVFESAHPSVEQVRNFVQLMA